MAIPDATCDVKRLRDLEQAVNSALFDLHRYMELCGDEFWREVYRHRSEVGRLVDARVKHHSRKAVRDEG